METLDPLVKAKQSGQAFALVTVVAAEGSTPARPGFRMVVYRDGVDGTVGGGALEFKTAEAARDLLTAKGSPRLVDLDLSELGMACGGRVTVFLEAHGGLTPLWIFGAGHIARALAPIVSSLPFRLTVADNRPGFAVPDLFPAGTELITGDYAAALAAVPAGAYAVLVTHGHLHDEEILLGLTARKPPLPYVGMIGSRRKIAAARSLLAEKGIEGGSLFAPIGLDLGGDSPAEIAVAVAAEILGVFHGRAGLPHCRATRGPAA